MESNKILKTESQNSPGVLVLLPLVALMAVLILVIFLVPSTYARILSTVETYQQQAQTESILKNKIDVLRNTPQTTLEKGTLAVSAVPNQNPAFVFLSQLKLFAATNNVTISSIKSNDISESNQIDQLELVVKLESLDFNSINLVLAEIPKIAPLTTIKQVIYSGQSEDLKTAEARFVVYWSELPKSLPAITEALPAFTSEELVLLDMITSLTQPQFTELQEETNLNRENPFN